MHIGAETEVRTEQQAMREVVLRVARILAVGLKIETLEHGRLEAIVAVESKLKSLSTSG
jgi:hypothetical protein